MIKTLHIGNFKAFAKAQKIPIRPITLIFGANSAGKSTIIHSLVLAHHASETGELNIEHTQIGGKSIDLGGFPRYVHRRDTSRHVEWTIELDASEIFDDDIETESIALELLIGERNTTDVDFGVTRYTVSADGQPILVMSERDDEHLHVDQIEREHALFKDVTGTLFIRKEIERILTEPFDNILAEASALVAGTTDNFCPELFFMGDTDGTDIDQFMKRMAMHRVIQQMNALADHAREQLQRLHYLGPLRSYPPRRFALSSEHETDWRADGEHAWDVLRDNPDVLDAVNQWLLSPERLSTPYELIVQELIGRDQLYEPLRIALEEFQQTVELNHDYGQLVDGTQTSVDIDAETEQIIERLMADDGERYTELGLLDRRSDTIVSHRDVGIGISQILPVLVNAFSLRGELIAIEQPEIHIHPRLQAELGDVFIQSALGEQRNQFLLETHSEHLILRILRRIRQTEEGELPPGIPDIRPENVAILYVEPTDKGAQVIEIPVTADGEFARPWPNGFFAERIEELL